MSFDSPEQLLNSFKAAALSVTKLYKTAAAAENKAREDGYQDCISDLLAFLDRENIGLCDGEGWKIRSWATEKLSGDPGMNIPDSEDDDLPVSPPTATCPSSTSSANLASQSPTMVSASSTATRFDAMVRSPSPHIVTDASEIDSSESTSTSFGNPSSTTAQQNRSLPNATMTVPTADRFTFQSSISYPNIDQLDLSDSAPQTHRNPLRSRMTSRNSPAARRIGYGGASQKRKINIAEIFDFGDLGTSKDKDTFGGGNKRNRLV